MLNEKDFTELGKRVHDLEADPPQDGWNKIAVGLKSERGTFTFISRHWKKSLILLIPVLGWIAFKDDLIVSRNASDQLKKEITLKSATFSGQADLAKSNMKGPSDTANENVPDTPQLYQGVANTDNGSQKQTEGENRAPAGLIAAHEHESRKNTSGKGADGRDVDEASSPTSADIVESEVSTSKLEITRLTTAALSRDTSLINAFRVRGEGTAKIALPKETLATGESVLGDSLESVTASGGSSTNQEKQQTPGGWRTTISFAPDYLVKSVRPVMNDEILITKMEDRKSVERIGFTAAFGVGRELRKNFFVDLQAVFSTQHERMSYTYTTGKVDTLIARQEENGSVRVTPVYASMSAEISSRLNYGGIRLGTTYYFWQRGRTRFNVSAAGAANFLLYSNVKENISGVKGGVARPANSMKTLTLSAGYNIKLGSGWEAQVNPSITYFSRNGNSYQQIHNLNQRSFGVNLTASKFF